MKKLPFLIALLSVFLFLNCSSEKVDNTDYQEIKAPNFRVSESTVKNNSAARTSYDEPCFPPVDLIAGQNHIAGTVSVDSDGENLIITYSTNEGWTIDLTHLSIGDCTQSIPTTGSGNPKVGKFEHTEPHSADTNNVIYMIDLNAMIDEHEIDDLYCFAAHAEVTGPTGEETAWAQGIEFEGNSWAMYVETYLSYCDVDDCIVDTDGDGICDYEDNCPDTYNPEQLDNDRIYNANGDVIGYQPDGVGDECDNCPNTPNEDQIDIDEDGVGDACKDVR